MNKICPFCDNNISEVAFAESENFRAIYNISPILKGHSLIITKRHIISFLDFNDDELNELAVFSRRTVKILMKSFNCEGFNISLQEGIEAGQSQEHFHLHIIPRKPEDLSDQGEWYNKLQEVEHGIIDSPERKKLSRMEMIKMAEFIKRNSLFVS